MDNILGALASLGVKPVKRLEIKYTKIFINNEWVNSINGATSTVINPSTEEKIAVVQCSDGADTDKAVAAAKAAFDPKSKWRAMDATDRADLMMKLAGLMEQNMDYFTTIDAVNGGKPFNDCLFEVVQAVRTMKYYAGWCDKITGKTIPSQGPTFTFTRHEPLGVIGLIVPWNSPLMNAMFKVAPALAAGCTVVLKPSEMTPLSVLYFCSLVKEAGFPPGVINVIPGKGSKCGTAITKHPDVKKVAFTGSTKIGKILAANCTETIKHTTLELGGKSPMVICADADLDYAVALAQIAVMANNGQGCINGSRTFVHESIYDEFVKKSVALCKSRVLGDIFDPKTTQGPQISEHAMNNILGYIKKGIDEGAKLECGGKRWGNKGYFVEPTIFSHVTDNMTIAREEIFGPVMSILKWSDWDDVIRRANDTCYGLASGIVTNDLNKALAYCQEIEAGNVWVNIYHQILPQAPFGGMKESGYGRECGEYGLQAYLEVKNCVMLMPTKHS